MSNELVHHEASITERIDALSLAIRTEIDNITVGDAPTLAIDLYGMSKAFASASREVKAAADAKCVEVLRVVGDVTIGDVRYYAAPNKTTKPRGGNGPVMLALLEACDGDAYAIADCMNSDPWKHGAVKSKLVEAFGEDEGQARYDAIFETVVTSKTAEGKPKKVVQAVNQNFVN